MGYLDERGLSHFFGRIKNRFLPPGGKETQILAKGSDADYDAHWVDGPSAGDGITIDRGAISVSLPVKALTSTEYDALTDEEKNKDVIYAVPSDAEDEQNSLATYSTEEVRVGTWIDGKPVYRKVVVGVTPSVYDTNVVFNSTLTSSYIDVLVSLNGCMKTTAGAAATAQVPINTSINDVVLWCWIRPDGLNIKTSDQTGPGHRLYIVAEYTKTAD